jgi:phosphatidylglycerophosphatase A
MGNIGGRAADLETPPIVSLQLVRRLLASWFGMGFIPRLVWKGEGGAGTVAGMGALVLALWAGEASVLWQLAMVVLIAGVGLWAVAPFASELGDPNWVTIDEAAGTVLAVTGLQGPAVVVAFLVFRAVDITKGLPFVAEAERLPGAVGVMADDLVAALYALAAGWATQLVILQVV